MIKIGDGTIVKLSEIDYAYIEAGNGCLKISFCSGNNLRISFDTRLEADKELDRLMIEIEKEK